MDQDRGNVRIKVVEAVPLRSHLARDPIGASEMKIHETQDYYVVTFFPDAEEVEIDDKIVEKGYKAIIGLQDGHHVIMKVMYDKSKYPLDEADRVTRNFSQDDQTVMYYASHIGECAICKRLDANVGTVTEITRLNQVPAQPVRPVTPVSSATSNFFNTGNLLDDLMSQMLYDTTLNPTGKAAVALALGDKGLIDAAMPRTIDGFVNMFADFAELSQGRGNLRRSPEEVTAYIQALREGAKPDEPTTVKKAEVPVFRRSSTVIIS